MSGNTSNATTGWIAVGGIQNGGFIGDNVGVLSKSDGIHRNSSGACDTGSFASIDQRIGIQRSTICWLTISKQHYHFSRASSSISVQLLYSLIHSHSYVGGT